LSDEQEEFDFALNEAVIFFNDNQLVIGYGDGRDIVMELESDHERQLVQTILSDVNFWAKFLDALSVALGRHR
jgi:hypothetical protein